MNVTFTSLPEAQKHARANNLPHYWRVIFPDRPSYGGWLATNHPREIFCFSLEEAKALVTGEMESARRVDVARLTTAEVSDSPHAR